MKASPKPKTAKSAKAAVGVPTHRAKSARWMGHGAVGAPTRKDGAVGAPPGNSKNAKAAAVAKTAKTAKKAVVADLSGKALPAKAAPNGKALPTKAAPNGKPHAAKEAPARKARLVKQPPSEASSSSPLVVGIGASAGGLEAFTQLLGALPTDTGMAFVLVQHLEPTHKSNLSPLLARATKMPVDEVREGMHVEPNHVYIIPSNADMSLLDGLLHITGRKAPAGHHLPIDSFFSSLAESRGPQAIGVVLSGTASDGTAGIKAIKAAGGITFAQEPDTAKFDGMPRNAIASGYIDRVLPPDRIARELARIVHEPLLAMPPLHSVPELPADEQDWERLFRVMRAATGVDFSLYKKSTLKRRLARRMAASKTDDLRTYLKLLESSRSEVDALLDELLILVTEFFREPEVFRFLQREIFPKMLAGKSAGEPIRIWVAGCSTGEEAYSIAISLLLSLGEKASEKLIQIFATDVSDRAIERARLGIYPAAALKQVPDSLLKRFFTKINGDLQVSETIREMCVFARHDLTRDPPFSRLDMVSCRNCLIYMEPQLQKRILASFHYALKPNGILLPGKSESLGSFTDLFSVVDRKNKFFRRSQGAHAPLALIQPPFEHAPAGKPVRGNPVSVDLEKEATQMVWDRYAHAGLVVNNDLQIVHFMGDTSPYVQHAAGKASLQLMRTLREEFVLEVRSALQKVRRGEPPVRREGIEFRRNSHLSRANVEIHPLIQSGPEKSFVILFESADATYAPAEPAAGKAGARKGKEARDGQVVLRLREELAQTREYVQAIIRDQEATNEELKTANEEALSSMEELQSTNEELETAKEELQSSNEELVTLNEQLQNRNSELGQLSTDLGNVLSGVDIPIVILGVDRRIRRFTPPAEHLLGLISGDIGRPISKLRMGVDVPDLDAMVAAAVEKCAEAGRELKSEFGRWYLLRVRPFLADGTKAQGVLLTFVDIDEIKKLQQAALERAEQSEATAQALLESAGQAILACDEEGHIKIANARAQKMFGYSREELIGINLSSLVPERMRAAHVQLRESWFAHPYEIAAGTGPEMTGLRKDGSEFPIEVILSHVQQGSVALQVAFLSDITERKKNEQTLADYSEQLSQEVTELDRLRRTTDKLWGIHRLRTGLENILQAGDKLLGADMSNIQLLNPQKQMLEIVAYRGFGRDYLTHFREVSLEYDSSCARSLRTGERIIIEDVNAPEFAVQKAAAAMAGYRAVESTPLIGIDGKSIGIYSAFFRKPHRPTDQEQRWLDLYAQHAAMFIERVQNEEQLQRVTRAVLVAQEEGNREIARELHDVFSQGLAALGMKLSSLKSELRLNAEQESRISELREEITKLATQIHQASRELHPTVVEDLGPEAGLRQACDSFQSMYGIPVEFTANNLPSAIPREASLCLYRVAQESLRNVQKHAGKTEKVWVFLTGDREGITLTVKDQGNGFELSEAFKKGSLGLVSMEERVHAEGGTLNIQSRPGAGTTVTAFVPLEMAWLEATELDDATVE